MLKNGIYFAVLLILIVVDASLLANPQPKQDITLFILNTKALTSFTTALLTVGGTVAACLGLAYLCRRFLSRRMAYAALLGFMAFSAFIALQVFVTFTYAEREELMGGEFVAGATLLGVLMILIFGKEAWAVAQNRDPKPSTKHL